MHNPNAHGNHTYSIIEDLAQDLVTLSAVKVFQSFPMQRKALLTTIVGVDTSYLNLMTFYPSSWKPYLPHHLSLEIMVHVYR